MTISTLYNSSGCRIAAGSCSAGWAQFVATPEPLSHVLAAGASNSPIFSKSNATFQILARLWRDSLWDFAVLGSPFFTQRMSTSSSARSIWKRSHCAGAHSFRKRSSVAPSTFAILQKKHARFPAPFKQAKEMGATSRTRSRSNRVNKTHAREPRANAPPAKKNDAPTEREARSRSPSEQRRVSKSGKVCCKCCGKNFSKKGVYEHMRHHCPKNENRTPRTFGREVCVICGKELSAKFMHTHMKCAHTGEPARVGRPPKEAASPARSAKQTSPHKRHHASPHKKHSRHKPSAENRTDHPKTPSPSPARKTSDAETRRQQVLQTMRRLGLELPSDTDK